MPDLNCSTCETETLEPVQELDAPLQIVGVAKVEDLASGPYWRWYECTTCGERFWRQDDPPA